MQKIKHILRFAFQRLTSDQQFEIERIFAGADAIAPEIIPPKPDDLAIAFAQAMMMAGKHDSPGACIYAAWAVVPEFYLARGWYAENIAPIFFTNKAAQMEDGAQYPSTSSASPLEGNEDPEFYTVQPLTPP